MSFIFVQAVKNTVSFYIMLVAAIIVAIVLIILYIHFTPKWINVDGRNYNVQTSFQNYKEAANIISNINHEVMKLLHHLRLKYQANVSNNSGRRTYRELLVDHLLTNYNPDKLFETNPILSNDTSYTINKGEKTAFCVRDKKNPHRFIDFQVIMFVVLHELAHIAAFDVSQHPEEFWRVFKFLIREAKEIGIYEPVDYTYEPIDYCGLHVSYNPYFDTATKDV